MSLKFTRTEELVCHRITAFPGKLIGVLHSQEDGNNIFPSQLHNMSELYAFHCEHPQFQKIFKALKKLSPLRGDNDHLRKTFLNTFPADVFHLTRKT